MRCCSEKIPVTSLLREIEIPMRVRYSETDQMGVVHHSNYFRYFEVARMEHFRAWGFSYKALEDSGLFLVIMDAECKFRSPALFDDVILVAARLEKATRYRMIHRYTIKNPEGKRIASGKTSLGSISREGLPCPLPDDFMELLTNSRR